MKKIKMIVTSVIVFAIVGSAFTFNAKKAGAFCVGLPPGCPLCTDIKQNIKRVTNGGTTYCYYPNWDGDPTTCIGTNNCTASIILTPN